ncbi:uncharacterized protein CDAR_599681 [Caerostris darwini]|uniref:Uncharacterized protein n=1 Tax=Caerostris darwini TaxID=1538125 RepID=A0AAV4RRJ1_9ARAC|nr:uncharacterized protein CDAR_599681 [Caerostris darwini]
MQEAIAHPFLLVNYDTQDIQDCVKDDMFLCDNGQCIPKELTCDGRNNCGDRSDEFFRLCDSKFPNFFQITDTVYMVIFSFLIILIVISTCVIVSRRRTRRAIDSDSVSDQDEPTSRLAPFQAVHPTGYFICQDPAGPDSVYRQHSKALHLDGGFSNPCFPNGVPQPPPPYSQ